MEIETEVGKMVVRMHASPAEAAAYVVALGAMQNGQNGHGGVQAVGTEPVPAVSEPPVVPELFPMAEPAAGTGGMLAAARALAAVPTEPPPPPVPPSDTLEFRVPNSVYEAIKASGVDMSVFNKAERRNMGPGYSWFLQLTAHDAVDLYLTVNAAVEKGAGKRVPSTYNIRHQLEQVLDNHFHMDR